MTCVYTVSGKEYSHAEFIRYLSDMHPVEAARFMPGVHSVPKAPFVGSGTDAWASLAMKRMIRYAAEHGYDRITWDTGETSAARYDLSKHIQSVIFHDNVAGSGITRPNMEGEFKGGTVRARDHSGQTVIDKYVNTPEELADVIGKEAAEKLLNAPPEEGRTLGGLNSRARELSGLNLKVGGEGMRGFYDRILPAAVAKLTKKYGGKVETSAVKAPSDEHEYRGPTPTDDQLEHLRQLSNRTGNTKISPITGQPLDFAIERVAVNSSIRAIMGDMARGESFADAMVKHGSSDVADIFGGKIARKDAENATPVHSLALTPAMRQTALSEGFPLFQGGESHPALRGRITLEDNRALINLFEHADASTFLHESAHLWLDELARDAAADRTPQALKQDFGTILRWLGADRGEDISVAQHEKFAQGFEQYLASGKAPSTALERAFAAFKDWLTAIYRDLRGLGEPIGEDVKGVFDRMLSPEDRQTIETRSPPPKRASGNAANLVAQPQTLLGFLKSRGGLRDDPELAGRDYRASYPGLMNNRRGMSLDAAREAAAEAGYLGGDRQQAMSQTTPRDLLDALENHPTYRAGDEDKVLQFKERQDFAEYKRTLDKERANLEEYAERTGFGKPDKEALSVAAELLASGQEAHYDNALERADHMLYNRDSDEAAARGEKRLGDAAPGVQQTGGGEPAAAGGPGERPGPPGPAPGARQAVPDPRQARRDAEWRSIAERSRAADRGAGDDAADLGDIAGHALDKIPASLDVPEKQLSALDASLAEAEQQWSAEAPYLDEAERNAVNAAMVNAGVDEEGKAEALRDLLNCLIVAGG
jgi:hypothetical protein